MSSIFYKIDHKKRFLYYDTSSLINIKSSLFYELSSKDESMIYTNILNLFKFLLKDYIPKSEDKIDLIYTLSQEFAKLKNIQIENYDKISQNFSKKIIKKNYKMDINFTLEELDDICTLLSLGFIKIFSLKKPKFKTYDELLEKLEQYNYVFIDITKIYKTYNFSVPSNAPEIPKGDVPNEIILLKEILQGIKHINLNLKNMAKNNILSFLLIILNYDWLFPFVFEVDLDLRYDIIENDIKNLYDINEKNFYCNYMKNRKSNYFAEIESDNDEKEAENKYYEFINKIQNINIIKTDFNRYHPNNVLNSKIKFDNINNIVENNDINDDYNNRFEAMDENYINLLIKNENTFDVMLCFFYLIKNIKYLKSLNIIMPIGFIKENIDIIKIRNIPNIEPKIISKINLFEYITTLSSINSFNIHFNCLEKKTFENILYIIQNNSNLKEIKLNFFPDELNLQILSKISEECGIFNKLNLIQNEKNIVTKDIEKILKQKLLEYLEINLEKLFLLFQTKRSLEKLELIIKLPSIFLSNEIENERYHILFIKFIFNVFILLDKEKMYLKEFKLILPNFIFDNRNYPIITEFLENINLLKKNPQLKIFILEAQLHKIYNLRNMISYNLQSINIGELDIESFKYFVEFYQSENFLINSQLKNLYISLNKNVIKYNNCKNYLSNFFSGKNPINLTEITFKCHFRVKRKNLYDLLKSGNGNFIKKYNIIIKIDDIKKYKKIIEHKDFYFMQKEIKEKISAYLPLLKKYNLFQEKHKKIVKNIIRFLLPSNIKEINIINIE